MPRCLEGVGLSSAFSGFLVISMYCFRLKIQILGGRGKNNHALHASLDFDTFHVKCFKRGNSDDKQGHNNLFSEPFARIATTIVR